MQRSAVRAVVGEGKVVAFDSGHVCQPARVATSLWGVSTRVRCRVRPKCSTAWNDFDPCGLGLALYDAAGWVCGPLDAPVAMWRQFVCYDVPRPGARCLWLAPLRAVVGEAQLRVTHSSQECAAWSWLLRGPWLAQLGRPSHCGFALLCDVQRSGACCVQLSVAWPPRDSNGQWHVSPVV